VTIEPNGSPFGKIHAGTGPALDPDSKGPALIAGLD